MTQYRQSSLRCPGCAEILEEQARGDVHVDICPLCRGTWIDWMDGDLHQVAVAVGGAGGGRAPVGPVGPCPHCRAPLERESLDGAEVWRCGHCVGAFVTRDAIAIIAGVTSKQGGEPEPEEAWLTRLLDRFGRFVTPG